MMIQLKFIKLLPRWIIYWATVRLFAEATTGKFSGREAGDITFAEAVQAWCEEGWRRKGLAK